MKSIFGWIEIDAYKCYTCCSTFATRAAVARVGWGRRRRRRTRGITGVRDEEKERYDRKSLALSPLPASPETCNTHPQHSGLSPPAWMRSPLGFFFRLCVCLRNFPPLFSHFAPSLFSLFQFCCSNSIHHSSCVCQHVSQICTLSSTPPLPPTRGIILLLHSFQQCLFLKPCFLCRCGYSYITFFHFSLLLHALALSLSVSIFM